MQEIDAQGLKALLLAGDARETVFAPNSGNAGDSLIAEATYQFFDRIGLAYSPVTLNDRLSKPSRVIIGGGGNLVMPYHNVSSFIAVNLDRCEELIILPHSIRGHEDVLARLDERCTIICREQRSFDFTLAAAPRAKVLLGHDMALLWNREETRRRASRALTTHPFDGAFQLRNLKLWVRDLQHRGKVKDGTLNAFREDVESLGAPLPPDNVDLSHVFATDSMASHYSARAVDALVRFLDRAERVRTDRLHIAILSTLLGKTVEMHDNNYGKNRSVYDRSLAGRFSNVTFSD